MRRACLLVVVAVVAAACGGADATSDGLVASLCAAVEADTAEAAAEVFESEVHRPLHTLAEEVGAEDRSLAADLLRTKYQVESVVRDDLGPAPLVRDRLRDLVERARASLEALDRPAPDC